MARAKENDPFTTISLRSSDVERLRGAKPYETMAWSEFINELLDIYEREAMQGT